MKLATYRDGSRDGQLVVVSRDLTMAHYATHAAHTLQHVLDDWNFISPQLQDLYVELNHGKGRHVFPFDPAMCMAPLPRAYQCVRAAAYARPSDGLAQAEFYRHSQDDPPWLSQAKQAAWKQASQQRKQSGGKALPVRLPAPDGGPDVVYQPNTHKTWEPVLDQTQLREAAQDFSDDYTGKTQLSFNLLGGLVTFFSGLSRLFSDDCGSEYHLLRQQAVQLYGAVAANSDLVALYDEHVHDSRAWFMHASLGKREPHGSYWRYRTVYYTDGHTNKPALCRPQQAVASG